jgi:hypothetical protein
MLGGGSNDDSVAPKPPIAAEKLLPPPKPPLSDDSILSRGRFPDGESAASSLDNSASRPLPIPAKKLSELRALYSAPAKCS